METETEVLDAVRLSVPASLEYVTHRSSDRFRRREPARFRHRRDRELPRRARRAGEHGDRSRRPAASSRSPSRPPTRELRSRRGALRSPPASTLPSNRSPRRSSKPSSTTTNCAPTTATCRFSCVTRRPLSEMALSAEERAESRAKFVEYQEDRRPQAPQRADRGAQVARVAPRPSLREPGRAVRRPAAGRVPRHAEGGRAFRSRTQPRVLHVRDRHRRR